MIKIKTTIITIIIIDEKLKEIKTTIIITSKVGETLGGEMKTI